MGRLGPAMNKLLFASDGYELVCLALANMLYHVQSSDSLPKLLLSSFRCHKPQ